MIWSFILEDTKEQNRNVRMKRGLTNKDAILPEAKRKDNRAEPLLQDVPMETTGGCTYMILTTCPVSSAELPCHF